ncbi:hypothetical protein PHMEG_00034347 [Phytophthora megakarya]|uniref:Uncharacterized protein n=1 Tax=Phytophthora megakarya TaxID=4795 RepID=A0A225USR7_9STRA|nr:hypothetical protein PHMEG_00034347 [Phytophthora megakarya]
MKFRHWTNFYEKFGFHFWIDHLSQERQGRIIGLFAGVCVREGHNVHGRGNKFQTFEGKMAAVAFAYKSVWNARLRYKNPEVELVALRYKRTNSSDGNSLLPRPCCMKCTFYFSNDNKREATSTHACLWGTDTVKLCNLDARTQSLFRCCFGPTKGIERDKERLSDITDPVRSLSAGTRAVNTVGYGLGLILDINKPHNDNSENGSG